MNQENCLEKKIFLLKKTTNKHFHLKTLFLIFLIIYCIDVVSFNSITNADSTNINENNLLTETEIFPKKNGPILPVQPFLHQITPPDYDTPYDIYLSWDLVINATIIHIFRSTTKNYSEAVLIADYISEYAIYYIDSDGKILGNTYYYFIRAFDDHEGFIDSNWQNVTLPQVLFDQPLEIKFSDVIFTVKCNANLSELRVYIGVGEEEGNFWYRIMESSNQKSEDGNYTFSKKVRIDSEGPLFYYYKGINQANDRIYIGNTKNFPLISPQDIRITTDHFKMIVGFVAIVTFIVGYGIVKKKVKNLKSW